MRSISNTVDSLGAQDAANWFSIQTKARPEEKVLCLLSRKAIPTFLLRLLVQRRHGSKNVAGPRTSFPWVSVRTLCS